MKFQDLLKLAKIAQSSDGVSAILKTDREICEMMGKAIIDLFGEPIACGFESAKGWPHQPHVVIPEQWAVSPVSPEDARTMVNSLMLAIDEADVSVE